jgi:glycosyltransferase involved in cell wall biosynthesis
MKFGISEKVQLYGFYDNLEEFLSALDIFVQPSRSEGFPLSLIEAMASGVPVISTDVGGTRKLLNDGEFGILVQEGDVENLAKDIIDLAESREKRAVFSKLSIARAKDFSIDVIGKSYRKIYEQISKN